MTDRRHVSRPRRPRSESLAWLFLPALGITIALWAAAVYILAGGPQ